MTSLDDFINLNVGGKHFLTTRMTLCSDPSSVLAKMFDPKSERSPGRLVDGAYFLDCNPEVFSVVLDYLRHKSLVLPSNIPLSAIEAQARYFVLDDLLNLVNNVKKKSVRLSVSGKQFEISTETIMKQPNSRLAKMVNEYQAKDGEEGGLFLDVCPQAFEILVNFLRSGSRRIPPYNSVSMESIGHAAERLGINICLPSKQGTDYCKISWVDERRDKNRFCNCRMLGFSNHKNSSTRDEWLTYDG